MTEFNFFCPLCGSASENFYKNIFYVCINCEGIFKPKHLHLSLENEKARYKEHNNDVEDIRYQNFVSPITNSILQNHLPTDKGLDFGSGTGPVISKVLIDKKYNILQYDPFFCNKPSLLEQEYDYIACCEVIEHFADPKKEFSLLYKLLRNKGKLYCMTYIYRDNIDFSSWFYKHDPTHVFFYKEKTINWIKNYFDLHNVEIHNRLIVFEKSI
jgi:SAM-dependent methyltransferase